MIRDELGQPVAALYAYGPSYRFPDPTQHGQAHAEWVGNQLRQQAQQISTDLGFVEISGAGRVMRIGAV